jgi:hypothetical protein
LYPAELDKSIESDVSGVSKIWATFADSEVNAGGVTFALDCAPIGFTTMAIATRAVIIPRTCGRIATGLMISKSVR